MKNFFILLISVTMTLAGCQNNSMEIHGTIEEAPEDSYIYFKTIQSNELVTVDSVSLNNDGEFSFTATSEVPMFYLLNTSENSFLNVLIEGGEKLKIVAHHDTLMNPSVLTGAEGTTLLKEYEGYLTEAQEKMNELSEIYTQNIDNPDIEAVMMELNNKSEAILDELNEKTKQFIDDNMGSLVTLLVLYQQPFPNTYVLHPQDDFDYFAKVDSVLYSLYPGSELVASLNEQMVEVKTDRAETESGGNTPAEGTIAPEIALPNTEGDTVRLSSTQGKIVLLDFWAAWCPPCRDESPYLVEAYDKYGDKGFEIFQVSLDRERQKWLDGIEADKLGRWIHVSDLMYWNSVVVPQYNIESIPYNLLLDRNGRIIDSNLRKERLLEVLDVLMNQ